MQTERITDFNNVDELDHWQADALNEKMWEQPECYGGHSPEGDIILAVRTRDSSAIERSNWECIVKYLSDNGVDVGADHDASEPTQPYDFRAGHWAVGWVEYLIVPQAAPIETLILVADALVSLAEYPIFNECHARDLEHNEANEFWAGLDVRERAEIIRDHTSGEVSMFAARYDYIPDNNGALDDYCRAS